MLLIRISDDHDREACCKKQVCVHTRVLQLWYGRTTVFLAAKKSMHSARGARAGFHKFSYFPLHGTRAARAHGFDSPPPSRTLEPLAFDEYCRFDTFCFLSPYKASGKQKYQNGNIHQKLKVPTSVILPQPKIQYEHGGQPEEPASKGKKLSRTGRHRDLNPGRPRERLVS